jgi:hypothetical protein
MGFAERKNKLSVAFLKEEGLYHFDKPKQTFDKLDKSGPHHYQNKSIP